MSGIFKIGRLSSVQIVERHLAVDKPLFNLR